MVKVGYRTHDKLGQVYITPLFLRLMTNGDQIKFDVFSLFFFRTHFQLENKGFKPYTFLEKKKDLSSEIEL